MDPIIKYQFQCNREIDQVINAINHYGIALIPDFLTDEMLNSFSASFPTVLSGSLPCIKRASGHPTNPDGKQTLFDPVQAKSDGFPEYFEVFREGLIKEVAESFFSPYKFKLNSDILLTHLKSSPNPILPWHFDRMQSLKFWIYVEDASFKNGALEYCPGTHWEGRYRAGYHMATGTAVQYIPNDIPEHRIQHPVTIEAKAGDLIIFDPDGFHRGGIVHPGFERKVIRADSFPQNGRRYADKPLTGGWWLRSGFNLAKWLKGASSRTLGLKAEDTTQIRERKN